MKIRMLKPFNALKAGTVLEQTDGVAELWIHCGRAERMVPEPVIAVTPKRRGRPRTQREMLA
jgi:hypothetical protein